MEKIQFEAIQNSSNVAGYAYDPATKQLRLKFGSLNSRKFYVYDGVAPETVKDFMAAESKGSFVAKQIKGKYRTTPVEE